MGAAVMARTAAGSQTLKVGRSEEIASLIRQKLLLLDLSPEQRRRVEPIIKKTSEELEASHLDCLTRCSAALEKLHAEIRPALDPPQQERLKQMDADRRALMIKKYNFNIEAAQTVPP